MRKPPKREVHTVKSHHLPAAVQRVEPGTVCLPSPPYPLKVRKLQESRQKAGKRKWGAPIRGALTRFYTTDSIALNFRVWPRVLCMAQVGDGDVEGDVHQGMASSCSGKEKKRPHLKTDLD